MAATTKITPLVKGLITGTLTIGLGLLLLYIKSESPGVQYLFYIIYAGGITWTLLDYSRSSAYVARFGSIFNQGFRCFIIVTLMHVIFTWIYAATHPEIAEAAAVQYEAQLKKEGNRNETEIKEMVASGKKQFVTGQVYAAIFGSLIIGSIFTAAGAGLLLMRRT